MSNEIPKTYKAYVQEKKGEPFVAKDVQHNKPEAGQVSIKVAACGVCHSDALVKYEVMPILPRVPGHEIVGHVIEVGEGVNNYKVGDYVGSGWHGYHDGECKSCRKGDFVTCEKQQINGVTRDGGYAEYCTLYANAVAKIPDDMDPAEAAPLLCAGVTVAAGLKGVGAPAGSIVAVQGIGGLGHLAIQYAHAAGYHTVALSATDNKKDLALQLGAKDFLSGDVASQVEALQKLGGADVIVCTAPNPEIIGKLVPGLAVGGTLLLLAVPESDLSVPAMPMIQKRLSIKGHPSGTAQDSEQAIAFAQLKGVKCQVERYPLEECEKAFNDMMAGKPRFRAVLVPGYKKDQSNM